MGPDIGPTPADPGRLIVVSGRPGVGKSTLARQVANIIGAVWLRIDSIEQAIRNAGVLRDGIDAAGYLTAHAVALDNLRVERTVIADCVNDWAMTRDAWCDIGSAAGARVFEIEIVCSDVDEHRKRVETRAIDVLGLRRPTWHAAIAREYHPWTRDHLVIDTSRMSVDAGVAKIIDYVGAV